MNLFRRMPAELMAEEENSVAGERDFASVNRGISLQNRVTNWAVIGGACLLAGVLLYKYYARVYDSYKHSEVPAKDISRSIATTALPPLAMPDPEPAKVSASLSQADVLPPLQPGSGTLQVVGTAQSGQPPIKPLVELVRERRLKREVRFSLEGAASGRAGALAVDGRGEETGATSSSIPLNSVGHGSTVVPASVDPRSGARAFLLADPTLMVTRGRAIPCTVVPAIDTSLTGVVTCVTAEIVTGADNKVALMDSGTLCTGKQAGGVVQGQRRVGIIWQRCETPQHVIVPLDAGASDYVGRPGIAGAVENHFWDRFGAAIALSLITDIGPYLAASRQNGSNNTTIAFPRISGPQEIMSEVLKSTVNIPPTITAGQGAQVLIYLADDLDFRDVYQLERVD